MAPLILLSAAAPRGIAPSRRGAAALRPLTALVTVVPDSGQPAPPDLAARLRRALGLEA